MRNPLNNMQIRGNAKNNIFGDNLRKSSGSSIRNKPHQGWDLYALEYTGIFAIATGTIANIGTNPIGAYGRTLTLQFTHPLGPAGFLYAFYAHLSSVESAVTVGTAVSEGQYLGLTGITGNASGMVGDDQHLHFEIRKISGLPGLGLNNRIDPALLFPSVSLPTTFNN